MGRGRKWAVAETKALVEAFIHISENTSVGTDQSSEQLFRRVSEEAKTRYEGDWVRSGDACKKRWLIVSREVMRFCSAMKSVETVEKSGWIDSDYFNHAKKYYCTRYEKVDFEYVAEWYYLKDFQKWKKHVPSESKHPATSDSKRSAPQEDGDETKEAEEPAEKEPTEKTPQKRPLGNKKRKMMQTWEAKIDQIMKVIVEKKDEEEKRSSAFLRMLESNAEIMQHTSQFMGRMMGELNNTDKLINVLEKQMEKLISQMERNSSRLQKSNALKALTSLDLSQFDDDFQEKARKKIQEEIRSILDF